HRHDAAHRQQQGRRQNRRLDRKLRRRQRQANDASDHQDRRCRPLRRRDDRQIARRQKRPFVRDDLYAQEVIGPAASETRVELRPPLSPVLGGEGWGEGRSELIGKDSPFYVPPFLHVLGGLVYRHSAFWLWLGRLESRLLAQELRQVPVQTPIYVCGLARSGSTLLHEVVSSHPSVATHRSKDYPMLFTPYWWRRATANLRPQAPR